jgi:hypothetical protein
LTDTNSNSLNNPDSTVVSRIYDEKVDGSEISLKEIIFKSREWGKYLISKWVIILTAAILGGILGYTIAYFKKPDYVAEYSFVLEEEKPAGIGGIGGIVSQLGIDGGGSEGVFAGDNLFQLIKSRNIIQKALLRTLTVDGKTKTFAEFYIQISDKLQKDWKDSPELLNIRFDPNTDPSNFTLLQNSVLRSLHNAIVSQNLTIEKIDKKLSFISIKVRSKNELFSKQFSEILTKEVSDFYIQTLTKKAAENLAILQHQTDSVRRALDFALVGSAASLDANPNPNPERLMLKVPSQLRQVEIQTNTAILSELVKNLEFAKISLRKETPLIKVIDKPVLPLPQENVDKNKWFIYWAILSSFLTIAIICILRIYKNIMDNPQ